MGLVGSAVLQGSFQISRSRRPASCEFEELFALLLGPGGSRPGHTFPCKLAIFICEGDHRSTSLLHGDGASTLTLQLYGASFRSGDRDPVQRTFDAMESSSCSVTRLQAGAFGRLLIGTAEKTIYERSFWRDRFAVGFAGCRSLIGSVAITPAAVTMNID
jgi:hypothetical protein